MTARYAFALLLFTACHKEMVEAPDAAVVTNDNISGTITDSATWSGTIHITGPTIIASSATITVAAGTTIDAVPGAVIRVTGHFIVQGTSTAKVVLKPATANGRWGGFEVEGGLTMHYADQTGGGIEVTDGTVTITDTVLSHLNDGRDFLIMNGGTLDMEYSTIGPAPATTDVIHCDFHFNNDVVNVLKVVHTDISGASYGADYFGGTGDFTFDNWFTNSADIVTDPGFSVTADFSNGWFKDGAPTASPGSSFTMNNLSQARLTDTGPRP